jgi:hypothetical protein
MLCMGPPYLKVAITYTSGDRTVTSYWPIPEIGQHHTLTTNFVVLANEPT